MTRMQKIALALLGCASLSGRGADTPLQIARQGVFSSGGTVTAPVSGDYIDNGPKDIMSTGFWRKVRNQAQDFARRYNADGGDATVIDLPRLGITGNSHFMFQETNNTVIADHLEKWLVAHGL